MKSLVYVLLLLLGLGNASTARSFFQFIGDSSLAAALGFASEKDAVQMADEAVRKIKSSRTAMRTVLGLTAQQRPLHAYFFPGSGSGYALVVGGMHGSELSSIEVAYALIDSLSAGRALQTNVVVVPELFPDNAALAASQPVEIGSPKNIGRYTNAHTADPNRQMPGLGNPFQPELPVDFAGRAIEKENQALLHLIQSLQPQMIFSLHAIRNTERAGVYADPRTDGYGYAQGYAADSALAVQMARHIAALGGAAPGNFVHQHFNALYPSDPEIAPAGTLQRRTIQGNNSSLHRGYGVSLGSWASTSERVYEESLVPRMAAMVFTIEFPGSRRTFDYPSLEERLECLRNMQAYASALVNVLQLKSTIVKN